MIGAEAIQKLLSEVDLPSEQVKVREELDLHLLRPKKKVSKKVKTYRSLLEFEIKA